MNWDELIESLQYAVDQMTWVEGIAVFFSILYVFLAARENIWCWAAAFVSVCLYIYICIKAQLFAETGLQVFYLIMAFVGYFQWQKKSDRSHRGISKWPVKTHVVILVVGTFIALGLGKFLENFTEAALPYFDSFTTIFSMITTWMVTKKILENWLYWVIIDASSVVLYANRDLYLTALLFVAYTIIAMLGYFKWLKVYNRT